MIGKECVDERFGLAAPVPPSWKPAARRRSGCGSLMLVKQVTIATSQDLADKLQQGMRWCKTGVRKRAPQHLHTSELTCLHGSKSFASRTSGAVDFMVQSHIN